MEKETTEAYYPDAFVTFLFIEIYFLHMSVLSVLRSVHHAHAVAVKGIKCPWNWSLKCKPPSGCWNPNSSL